MEARNIGGYDFVVDGVAFLARQAGEEAATLMNDFLGLTKTPD